MTGHCGDQSHAVGDCETYRAIVQSSSDFIFIKDREGRYLSINPAGAKALGKSITDVVGCDDFALFPEDAATEMRLKEIALLADGRSKTFRETYPLHARETHLLTTKSAIRDSGEILSAFWGLVGT